jgi:hypothetical protein
MPNLAPLILTVLPKDPLEGKILSILGGLTASDIIIYYSFE